jgi:Lipocalin-like domain
MRLHGLVIIFALVIAAGCTILPKTGGVPPELIGTWVPVSAEDRMASGEVHYPAYGHYPQGYLTYDSTGHMTVQLMNPDREKLGLRTASLEQFKTATTGFLAYSGTYNVSRTNGMITHHVDCALDPADLGTDMVRNFVLSADKLVLTLGPYNEYGTVVESRTLIWKRLH